VLGITSLLAAYPEVNLAIFLYIGMVKGDPQISSLVPVDLTAVLAALLLLSCVFRYLRPCRLVPLPSAFGFYLPLIGLMVASLFYTPDLAAGVQKASRFLLLNGLAIIAPFILLDSPRRMRRFLYTVAGFGVLLAVVALDGMRGHARLTIGGGDPLQLGTAVAEALAVFWSLLLPEASRARKLLFYPATVALTITLLSTGSRGPAIGVVGCIALAIFLYRRLLKDVAVLTALTGAVAVLFVHIPADAFAYLATLTNENAGQLLSFRADLMALAWRLIREHPLLGVGIGGYSFYSPDPNLYDWPHNIFLELGAELGVFATAFFTALLGCAFWAILKQIRDRHFPFRALSVGVFSLMIFEFLQVIKSGDINQNRELWLLLGLPFILRHLATRTRDEKLELG
jgi:O-antigen ligase